MCQNTRYAILTYINDILTEAEDLNSYPASISIILGVPSNVQLL